jgi:glucose-6-phosphate 1-dehydrogenase
MLQNHLLQLLCITAMEAPVGYNAVNFRQATTQVLEAVRPINPLEHCVLGQYGGGVDEHGRLRAYREEDDVPAHATTPTFVALKLMLDTWRWAGVPFYLRTGKRLPRKVAEITLQFKPTSTALFAEAETLPGNALTFRLQPDEGIHHTFVAKQPGPGMCLQPVTMHFCYDDAFGIHELPSAYEWLLLDAMHGDQTLFPSADWIYKAWAIVDPLVRRWEALPPDNLPNYAAGTWGPAEAEALLLKDGHTWCLR